MPVLELRNIVRRFGAIHALSAVGLATTFVPVPSQDRQSSVVHPCLGHIVAYRAHPCCEQDRTEDFHGLLRE